MSGVLRRGLISNISATPLCRHPMDPMDCALVAKTHDTAVAHVRCVFGALLKKKRFTHWVNWEKQLCCV
jgi:hypothetical protein